MRYTRMFDHFLDAQAPVYARATAELEAGRKESHWMWFIFPQLRGLGRSAMAQRFALDGLDDARAYLAHDTLGARLVECTELALKHPDRSAQVIFGQPDDLKFCSSMTLFARAGAQADGAAPFQAALDVFFSGRHDEKTLTGLKQI